MRLSISALGRPAFFRPKRQVAAHGHLRVERVGLEHHADAAVLGLLPGDVLALDPDLAVGDVEQPGDAVEQRRLAAARRAEQHDELALGDVDVQLVEDRQRAVGEGQVLDRDAGSACWRFVSSCAYPLTAPAAMPRTKSLPEMK